MLWAGRAELVTKCATAQSHEALEGLSRVAPLRKIKSASNDAGLLTKSASRSRRSPLHVFVEPSDLFSLRPVCKALRAKTLLMHSGQLTLSGR